MNEQASVPEIKVWVVECFQLALDGNNFAYSFVVRVFVSREKADHFAFELSNAARAYYQGLRDDAPEGVLRSLVETLDRFDIGIATVIADNIRSEYMPHVCSATAKMGF